MAGRGPGDPLELVDEQAASELRLKPGALRRHDLAGVGHGEEFVGARGMHGKRHTAGTCPPFELVAAADAADKFDPGISPRVADSEDWGQYAILEQLDIEARDRIDPIDR